MLSLVVMSDELAMLVTDEPNAISDERTAIADDGIWGANKCALVGFKGAADLVSDSSKIAARSPGWRMDRGVEGGVTSEHLWWRL